MEFIQMIKKHAISLCALFTTLFTLNVLAEVVTNPFRQSVDLTKKYMPQAMAAMWQSEHLIWRAQLFNAACKQDFRPVNYAINAGFPLVNQYIIDQAIMAGDLPDKKSSLILQDSNKLYYKIFSEVYSYAYIKRLRIIQHFHPAITTDLCTFAEKSVEKYRAVHLPILPWQITNQAEFKTWRADLFSMRVVNKHFFDAFIKRLEPFAHIVDAEIYAWIQQDKPVMSAFSILSNNAKYDDLLMNEIEQVYRQAGDKALPNKLWRASYAQDADLWASQAYKLATVSALMQTKTLFPELYQDIETHTISYIKLQLSRLEASKQQLNSSVKD